MQTRRDQLQAYRFQNRRALAALVTGQPNVLEPPMRRLTVTTLSGIMIAILIALVFGVLAIIHPTAGDSWKTQGAVVVDSDNNSTYIYTKGALHPVLNYTSAVLAASGSSAISPVKVSSSDIAGAKYSYEIGIPNVPTALPPQSSLIDFPMSVCSVKHQRAGVGTTAKVTLHIGSTGGSAPVPATQGVLVATPDPADGEWLLFQGQRLLVGSPQIASALRFTTPVTVGTAFLDSVPMGTELGPPSITDEGHPSQKPVGGRTLPIGTVLKTADDAYLVLATGTVPLTPLELDLFAGSAAVPATRDAATAAAVNLPAAQNPLSAFADLPVDPPDLDPDAEASTGACAVYAKGATDPTFVLPAPVLTSTDPAANTVDSDSSKKGLADKVEIPATKGLLATPAGAPHTVLIVSDQGIRYSFQSASLITAFGYSASDVARVPPQLLTLIPSGPRHTGLSKAAALRRPGN